MKGFDPRWRDVPDFILGITREIWEARGIHTLRQYYGADMPVRSPASVVVGNQGVIAATMATLAEFSDRELLGEDVIWCGNEKEGFLSSHRLLSTATHANDGVYGKASGKPLAYRIIADCAARDNAIYDEWLVRDQGAIVRQLGWEPKTYARDLIAREGGPENCVQPMTPHNDVPAKYQGRGNDDEWGARYAEIISRIMAADFAVIPAQYDRACFLEYAGGVSGRGWAQADQFWMGLRAAFPDAEFTIEHVIGRHDPLMPPRAALRWSLFGKHSGWGSFGTPSGAEVYILGMSHAEFGPFGNGGAPTVRREYALIDETAIWKQILLRTGDI